MDFLRNSGVRAGGRYKSNGDSFSDAVPAMWKDNPGSAAAKRASVMSIQKDLLPGIRPDSVLGGEYQVDISADPSPYGPDSPGISGYSNEKFTRIRESRHIAKGGGWRRLGIGAIAALLCLVALIVGLVLGLRHQHSNSTTRADKNMKLSKDTQPATDSSGSSNGGDSNSSPGDTNKPTSTNNFPAGSFAVETFLDTVSTDCTSNAATWQCRPFNTYAESPSSSGATFNWVIELVQGTNNYTISSTPNDFAINFTDTSLTLKAAGTAEEAYFFQISADMPVAAGSLGGTNEPATCYYNATTFQAYLYTKRPKSYPAAGASSVEGSAAFQPWPYAAKVEQVIGAGPGTPTCVDAAGNPLGDFTVSDGTKLCDCLYLNTGT
ncbi:hypothetical protein F5884DRAFT_879452 [Xylogone sp. PMI_703]|nr:hypothetical protein F5884DRAFT_879452 [Xylogone sp. PMI_703]